MIAAIIKSYRYKPGTEKPYVGGIEVRLYMDEEKESGQKLQAERFLRQLLGVETIQVERGEWYDRPGTALCYWASQEYRRASWGEAWKAVEAVAAKVRETLEVVPWEKVVETKE